MDKLYGYTFHFNTLRGDGGQWAAIPRGKEAEYFNDMTGRVITGVLYATDVNILVDFLATKSEEKGQ